MRNSNVLGWAAGLIGVCAACSSTPPATGVTEWQGSTPHFQLGGSYKGEKIDISIQGGDAANLETLSCVREYQAPLAADGKLDLTKAKLWELKVQGAATVNGDRRRFELEFKRQDFTKTAKGATLAVIPRDDATLPAPGQFWFEWEWHDAATNDTLDERSAQQGTFVMGELTGQPDEHGIVPDETGTFGGFVTAKWSESETVTFSFTADCGKNEIESDE